MNRSFDGGSWVHRGLRLTPASELAEAHAPGWLWPRGLAGTASTQRGASGEPHRGLWRPAQRRGKAGDKEEAARGEPRRVTTLGGPIWAKSAWEDWAGCENFQGIDLGYQGESGWIDNWLWQILFTIFKQRFGFQNEGFQISNQNWTRSKLG
jgi:hypothetical protein